MVGASSTAEAAAAIRRASDVRIEAYTLRDGAVVRAAEAAARAGARVRVRLEARPFGHAASVARQSRSAARDLRRSGAAVEFACGQHAKAIDADGALFLDGRNWGSRDMVVRVGRTDDVAQTKGDALAREAALLGANSRGAIVESETFGSGNAVYAAIERAAKRGESPRLLVNARRLRGNATERAILERLMREGVRVRVTDDAEKCALAGNTVWLGSANASCDRARMRDWGLVTKQHDVVSEVRHRLNDDWNDAVTLSAP